MVKKVFGETVTTVTTFEIVTSVTNVTNFTNISIITVMCEMLSWSLVRVLISQSPTTDKQTNQQTKDNKTLSCSSRQLKLY